MRGWLESFRRGWNAPPMAYQGRPAGRGPGASTPVEEDFREAKEVVDGFSRHLPEASFREELRRLIDKYDRRPGAG